MHTPRGRLRRPLAALAAAALLVPVSAAPASAAHIRVVDITRTACTDEVRRGRFDDVAPDSTFAMAIDCVAWHGITTGSTPTAYNAAATVTRLQMALFVQRLAESLGAELDTTDVGFTDLGTVSAAGRLAINGLANAGVVTGTGSEPKTYSPTAPVTRAQMAAYLNRLEGALMGQPFKVSFDYFDDDSSSPLKDDIDALAAAGIVSGTGQDRTYNPSGLVTRGQMAGFMARYLEVYLFRQTRADLTAPASVDRGTTVELEYVFDNPDGDWYDGVQLDWFATSESGLRATDVAVSFLDPTTGNWESAPWEEEFPGERGAVFTSGVWRTFSLPAGATTLPVRVTIAPDAPVGQLELFSALNWPLRNGELIAETYDVLVIE